MFAFDKSNNNDKRDEDQAAWWDFLSLIVAGTAVARHAGVVVW